MILKLRPLATRPDLPMPAYATEEAAGLDLLASEAATLAPGARATVGTGLEIELPAGYEGQVRPRSGLASKHGITVLNAPGTIDSDYRGELRVLLVNLSQTDYPVGVGDRIAQLVIAPVVRATVVVTSELSATGRGAGGFGHTGR